MRSGWKRNFAGRIAAAAMAAAMVLSGAHALFHEAEASADAGRRIGTGSGVSVQFEADSTLAAELQALLEAPGSVTVQSANDTDNPSKCIVTYDKSAALTAWLSQDEAVRAALLDSLGYSECKVFAQVDWAIDSLTAWHYSDKWDTDTGHASVDEEHPDEYVLGEWAYIDCPCTTSASDSVEIFQELGNPKDEEDVHWSNGRKGDYSTGWGSVLKESQYKLVTIGNTDNPDGEENADVTYRAEIPFDQHTVFVRVRYGVKLTVKASESGDNGNAGDGNADNGNAGNTDNGNTADGNTGDGNGENADGDNTPKVVYVFSDWSRTAAYGKEADNPLFHLPELFQTPVIENVKYLGVDDTGSGPYIAFTLKASTETVEAAKKIAEDGGFAKIYVEARKAGGGDTDWVMLGGEEDIVNGEIKVNLLALGYGNAQSAEMKDIELRALYYVFGSDQNEYETVPTEIVQLRLTEGDDPSLTPEISPTSAPTPTSSPYLKELLSETVEKKKDTHCKICGVCPVQPLGICLFVWIAGVPLLLLIILLIMRHREERRRGNYKRKKK